MMRPAVKHWLLLIFLAVTLAAMIAFALWQMSKARQRGQAGHEQKMLNAQCRMFNVQVRP
jgi:hypothetical protein